MSAIVADLTTVIERCYDRWENAFNSARARDYTAADWAKDLAEGCMDVAYLSMLPGARLAGVQINVTEPLPIMRFIVIDKSAKLTQVIRVHRNGVVKENLTKTGGLNIPLANYTATMAVDGTRYLYVELDCPTIDGIPTPAGVYEGNVKEAGGRPVARIVVVWPG